MTALLTALLLAQAYYTPEEAQALFQEANQAYGKGDYAAARERYERLLAHGRGGSDVLYNLGTTALAEGRLGDAVLNLERARRKGGAELDVEGNLALARTRQLDQVMGETADEPLGIRFQESFSTEPLAWFFVSAWALAWTSLTAARIRSSARGWFKAIGLASLLLVALPAGGVLAAEVYAAHTVKEGVVLEPTLSVRELPSSEARVSFEVHAGLRVRVLQQVGEQLHLRLPNGLEGWVDRRAIGHL